QQADAAERLQGIRKRAEHEQPSGMRRVRVEVTMHHIHRDREHAALSPLKLVLPLVGLRERRVSATCGHSDDLLVEMVTLNEGFGCRNLPNTASMWTLPEKFR